MSKKIHIIGSCTTRDIFRVLMKDNLVGKYSSRSSLISRVSPPLKYDLEPHLNYLKSNWQQRMVRQDFEKNGLHLKEYTNGMLIIDFIDERLQLFSINDTCVTKSPEFVNCGLGKVLKGSKKISRGSHHDFKLWVDACQKFTKLIPEYIRKKTILHRAFYADRYLQNGNYFDFEDQDKIKIINKNLLYYYDTFESIFNPGYIIEIPHNKIVADPNHLWKLDPFHYVNKYYEECYEQILNFYNSLDL